MWSKIIEWLKKNYKLVCGALALVFAFILGKKLSDNRNRVERDRKQLKDSAERTERIERRIDNASEGVDGALSVIEQIRKRGENS